MRPLDGEAVFLTCGPAALYSQEDFSYTFPLMTIEIKDILVYVGLRWEIAGSIVAN
jgi:hypothetical protein